MSQVIAAIDGSTTTAAVCDCAAWASHKLMAPLTLLHVIEGVHADGGADLSGAIGLGSREQLLARLTELDEQRSRAAREQGQLLLEAARERVAGAGVSDLHLRQRHGNLADTLVALEDEIRLLVMGRCGQQAGSRGRNVGSQLETVVRSLHRHILVTTDHFTPPTKVMIAFDGSASAERAVAKVAATPLLSGLPCHLVMVGHETEGNRQLLTAAASQLQQVGCQVTQVVVSGEVEPSLRRYASDQQIDLLVMGAWGHSRVRQFFVGSTTTAMIQHASQTLLLVR